MTNKDRIRTMANYLVGCMKMEEEQFRFEVTTMLETALELGEQEALTQQQTQSPAPEQESEPIAFL